MAKKLGTTKPLTTMVVPKSMVKTIKNLLKVEEDEQRAIEGAKPIKRKQRFTTADERSLLKTAKQLDKLGNKAQKELYRLQELIDTPLTRSDEQWVFRQIDRLDNLLEQT